MLPLAVKIDDDSEQLVVLHVKSGLVRVHIYMYVYSPFLYIYMYIYNKEILSWFLLSSMYDVVYVFNKFPGDNIVQPTDEGDTRSGRCLVLISFNTDNQGKLATSKQKKKLKF